MFLGVVLTRLLCFARRNAQTKGSRLKPNFKWLATSIRVVLRSTVKFVPHLWLFAFSAYAQSLHLAPVVAHRARK